MNLVTIILVGMGLLALCGSLLPLTNISRYKTGQQLGWRIIYVLNAFFILGYIYFLTHLWHATTNLVDIILSIIFWGGGVFVYLVSQMSLSSLQCIQQAASNYEKQALHDALTGLPNRQHLLHVLEDTYAARGRDDDVFSVMVMDLNGFKEINDTLGHQAGDRALQLVAPRLSSQLRSSDTLCRLGGDEFAVVLPKTSSSHALAVAKKILKSMELSFEIENHDMLIGVSIGIASCPEHSENIDALIQFADIAMYQAKRSHSGAELYQEKEDPHSIKNLNTPHLLKKAIAKNEIELLYQPICEHKKAIAVEAIIQWPSIEDEKLSESYCMSKIENLGLEKDVNHQILNKTLSQFSKWKKNSNIKLHLNLIFKGVINSEFKNVLKETLDSYHLKPSDIVIEIPESALKTNDSSIRENLEKLSNLGAGLSIRDFGGKGAGLLLIKEINIKNLKLGRAFSENLFENESNQAIIQAAHVFCNRLGIKMCIDGIEFPDDIHTLKKLGVERYQGPAYCPLLTKEEIPEALIRLIQL